MRKLLEIEWLGLLLIALFGSIILAGLKPAFLSTHNLYVLMLGFSLSVLVALAQMVIIAIGQMNLSVGAIGGMVAIVFAGSMEVFQFHFLVAALIGLGLGLLAGFANGYITVKSGISAFVVTLATLSVFKGINLGITEAQPFYDIPNVVKQVGNARIGPVPWLLFIPLLVILAMAILMSRTVIGKQILAVGANTNAASLSGISITRVVVIAHMISGALAAIAGMLTVARLQLGDPMIGNDWLLISFAAPVIGGAVLAGGKVSVIGTCLGVVIITLISNALVLLQVDPFYVQLLLGALILGAVGLNRYREVRHQRVHT